MDNINDCFLCYFHVLGKCPSMVHSFKGIMTHNCNQECNINLTNRFQVAVRLFSNRSKMTSKCGKNKKVAHKVQPSVSMMFLPHFGLLCDLLLNRRTATWNLFVLYNKELKKVLMMMSSIRLSSNRP